MSGLIPYLLFPGNATEALTAYASIFGGEARLFTYEQAGRTDGPGEAIAHGMLLNGPVEIAGADAAAGEQTIAASGMFFSLLGTAQPPALTAWFDALAVGGTVIDPLQKRPWGDHDGTLVDRFGVPWLIGYQG
ncbi:VOC family protein [Microbacterium esteraromaticum]|uniref:VOC family protein n=1 Tax=Microbacterium esteraromaticum TaxID=57043 RepID=UPI0019D339B5|nr:VOC family protein [Microbacterium esteraromaticum]MBN7794572.1 VOC family protein [Microbacterium esteraromaticum]